MRFICDSTLGKLTKYFRILGFDTISISNPDTLIEYKSIANSPLLFTKRSKTVLYQPTIIIQTNSIQDQIKEVADIIKPYINSQDFMTRCIECNTVLESAEKSDIEARVPEYIFHQHKVFKICPSCKKVYWEGTHVEHMKKLIGVFTSLE